MPTAKQIIAKERKALMKLMDKGEFAIPSREVDVNLLIASWNIAQFSNTKTNRAIQYIADICERFDIIAIQEVKTDLRGLARLQNKLPGNYKILVCDPTGNHERMAFLYDKRTVMSTGLVCEIGFSGSLKDPIAFQFNRMPYCASFRAGRFDFVMASVHIAEASKLGEDGLALREKEIETLVKFVKRRSKQEGTKVFDRDFMIVGDFNIQKDGDRFFKALTEGKKPRFFMPPGMKNLKTNFLRTKTYDKIAWLPRKGFVCEDSFNVVPYGKVLYKEPGQSKKAASKAVSDHLPIWVELKINKLTQELSQILNPGA